jgi:hypothetical protein
MRVDYISFNYPELLLDGEVAMAKETIDKVLYLDPMHGNKKKEV